MKKIVFLILLPFHCMRKKDYEALFNNNNMQGAVNVYQLSGFVLIAKHKGIIYQKTFGT